MTKQEYDKLMEELQKRVFPRWDTYTAASSYPNGAFPFVRISTFGISEDDLRGTDYDPYQSESRIRAKRTPTLHADYIEAMKRYEPKPNQVVEDAEWREDESESSERDSQGPKKA